MIDGDRTKRDRFATALMASIAVVVCASIAHSPATGHAPAPAAVAVVVPVIDPPVAPAEPVAPAPIEVPLVVNLYRGAVIDAQELERLLEAVNAIYAPAHVRFAVVDARTDADHPDEGWTDNHREELRASHRGHLDHLFGRLGGVSINFTHQPKAAKDRTNGVAYGESGVVLLRRHPTGLEKTAETLAHELAHTMGLSDLYGPHDCDRLRYGYSRTRTGVTLSPEDIVQVRAAAAVRAGEAVLTGESIRDAALTAAPIETSSRTTAAP